MISGGDGSSHCPTCSCWKKARKNDRFSELPDHLLRRILSFLYSKLAVQTCALSPRWRSVWKGVPVLNLDTKSFNNINEFDQFVSGIISSRHDSAPIHEISVEIGSQIDYDDVKHNEIGCELFAYAASHGIRRLHAVDPCSKFLFRADFSMVATLHLEDIILVCPGGRRIEPFAGFPNLRDLTLESCEWLDDDGIRGVNEYPHLTISGNRLRNLRIQNRLNPIYIKPFDLDFPTHQPALSRPTQTEEKTNKNHDEVLLLSRCLAASIDIGGHGNPPGRRRRRGRPHQEPPCPRFQRADRREGVTGPLQVKRRRPWNPQPHGRVRVHVEV
ncbi:unnamed protein product [Linum trigynum]|uniref:F-box domain-containing protein n=1 Tax=Linum trigynum TaxID=586398 RepID=A0AAV2DQB4_9ROSI